jgi:hypothetical protein
VFAAASVLLAAGSLAIAFMEERPLAGPAKQPVQMAE